ncbi:MAG: hypothetical protein HMLKMBBP_02272 [Planctomycetes bacterium]|nr:hypothetical protein [Planctomycetota bacterium]
MTSRIRIAGRSFGALAALAAVVAAVVAAPAGADPPETALVRLADIRTSPAGAGSYPSEFAVLGGRALFAASSGEHAGGIDDRELWITDGSAVGTERVADIRPGLGGSDPRNLVSDGTRVWFSAVRDPGVRDLWTTDGTAAGTVRVSDFPEGARGLGNLLRLVGTNAWFTAHDAEHGQELWVSDGTDEGTRRVTDIRAGSADSYVYELVSFGGRVWFTCDDGVHGMELWSTDGTPEGTAMLADLNPSGGADVQDLTVWKGALWFRAQQPDIGHELWRTDGTADGTVLVKDLWPGSNSGFPNGFTDAGDVMYFAGQGTWTGYELWRTDGTPDGTWLVRDIYPGSGGSAHEFVMSGGVLYFGQNEPGTGQFELFRSDGTWEGTTQVADIWPGSGGNPSAIRAFEGGVIFAASDGVHGRELWRSDGTPEGTAMVLDMVPGADDGGVGQGAMLGGRLVFGGGSGGGGSDGWELWTTDGTAPGTTRILNLCPDAGGSSPRGLRRVGPRAVFDATGDDAILAPYSSDGTVAGTVALRAGGLSSASAGSGAVVRGLLFFAGESPAHGRELWTTDGTDAGTRLVADLAAGASGSSPAAFSRVGDRALFVRGDTYGEVWVSDGTADGTSQLAPGVVSSSSEAVPFGSRSFFAGSGDGAGYEPWITDGTAEGTRRLRDIVEGSGSSSPRSAVAAGGFVWFLARDAAHGEELWRTDGTPEGTVLVADARPGPQDGASLGISGLPDGSVVFAAWSDEEGRELWRSDGTEEGTSLLLDLVPGPGSSDPLAFVRCGDRVYFSTDENLGIWVTDGTPAGTRRIENSEGWEFACLGTTGVAVYAGADEATGRELWRTDGTDAGTWLVADVSPGPSSSSPTSFGWAGGSLFFSAWDEVAGREPWALPLTACGVTTERFDSDGDGASDRIETLAGTSPWDGSDSPLLPDAGEPDPLPPKAGRIALDFRKPLKDRIDLTGTVHVPAGFEPEGAEVLADVGGVTRRFVLDRKGRSAPRGPSAFSVALKRRGGVVVENPRARFTLVVSKDTCAPALVDEGLTAETSVKKASRRVAAMVIFAGRAHEATLDLRWTATAGKSGVAR